MLVDQMVTDCGMDPKQFDYDKECRGYSFFSLEDDIDINKEYEKFLKNNKDMMEV